jgi:exoribonuclease-2
MLDRGLVPDFSNAVLAELEKIRGPATGNGATASVDLRNLLWCSLDNDDSRDLDQLTAAEALSNGAVKILIAIADVDAIVRKQSAIDMHAQQNTTSVYTVPEVFSMLPERLSTDITSLNFDTDRLAVIIEMTIAADGSIKSSALYQAKVHNRARLSYNSVAAWLDGVGPIPPQVNAVKGMEKSLRLQDSIAQKLKSLRHLHGALVLETIEAKPVFSGDTLINLEPDTRNRAKELIEDFMIAANGVTARYLASKHFPAVRRIVRTPKRWDRIVALAAEQGTVLPAKPDPKALEDFLVSSKNTEPLRFPDLSLSIIKLLGQGEYIVQVPGSKDEGHFGLAVKDYMHSTAPNRRYPDLITQRLLKAAIAGLPVPYSIEELESLARHCTEAEDAAKKVERQVIKSAAAILLESRIGERFDAIVTGASEKGTWVRITDPPLEGRLESGFEGMDVGETLRVQLISTDVERGFIDFKRV